MDMSYSVGGSRLAWASGGRGGSKGEYGEGGGGGRVCGEGRGRLG